MTQSVKRRTARCARKVASMMAVIDVSMVTTLTIRPRSVRGMAHAMSKSVPSAPMTRPFAISATLVSGLIKAKTSAWMPHAKWMAAMTARSRGRASVTPAQLATSLRMRQRVSAVIQTLLH